MHESDSHPERESRLRSVLKAITYRITGTITTTTIVFFVTGELAFAAAVGVVEPLVKLVVYYLHERAWQRVPHGAIRRLSVWRPWRRNG